MRGNDRPGLRQNQKFRGKYILPISILAVPAAVYVNPFTVVPPAPNSFPVVQPSELSP